MRATPDPSDRSETLDRQELHREPFVSTEVPLYYQLGSVLRDQILSGRYRRGQQLPSQAELARAFGVSRLTAREALKLLAQDGLVRRIRGRGTFVAEDRPTAGDIPLDSSIDDLIAMGTATTVKLLSSSTVPATAEEAESLGIDDGAPVVRCERLRFFRDEPYCYIVNTVRHEIGERIDRRRWEEGSVLKYIESRLGIPLREAQQRLRAVLAEPVLARGLRVRVGSPLLRVDYVIRTDARRVVERARLFYRSDLYTFTLDLTRNPAGASEASPWSVHNHRIER